MKKIQRIIAAVITTVALVFVGVVPAGATTQYDDVVALTNRILLRNDYAGVSMDLTTDWYAVTSALVDDQYEALLAENIYSQDHVDYLNLQQGDWTVSTFDTGSSVSLFVHFTASNQGAGIGSFDDSCDYPLSECLRFTSNVNIKSFSFSIESNGVLRPQGTTNNSEQQYASLFGGSSYEYLFLSTFNITYPAGYEGLAVPDTYTPPAPKYVAMGDSFSSGEGNPPFEGSVNGCHRSPQAYPRLLSDDPTLDLWPMDFVACSGASTDSILNEHAGTGNWNEGAQIDALSADTEVVTITIGGNDVGFKDYVHGCAVLPCGPGTFDYNYIMDDINDIDFFQDLEETYSGILNKAPNAEVYVIGYPHLATETMGVCGVVDMSGAWEVQSQLNAVIVSAVNSVISSTFSTRLHYIDPNIAGSPFQGNYVCSGSSDFHGLTIPFVYSFHPNVTGQLHYKELVSGIIAP